MFFYIHLKFYRFWTDVNDSKKKIKILVIIKMMIYALNFLNYGIMFVKN